MVAVIVMRVPTRPDVTERCKTENVVEVVGVLGDTVEAGPTALCVLGDAVEDAGAAL